MTEKIKWVTAPLPAEYHKRAKLQSVQQDMSMQDYVAAAVIAQVEADEAKQREEVRDGNDSAQ